MTETIPSATGTQPADQPTRIVHRYLEDVVNGGNLDLIDELWAEDLHWHGASMGDIYGLTAFKQYMTANAANAFTGMHLQIEDTIAADDKVVIRFVNSGTQTGPFMGAPATGKYSQWLGIGIYTVSNGKISEAWFGEDILGMLLQLGAVTL